MNFSGRKCHCSWKLSKLTVFVFNRLTAHLVKPLPLLKILRITNNFKCQLKSFLRFLSFFIFSILMRALKAIRLLNEKVSSLYKLMDYSIRKQRMIWCEQSLCSACVSFPFKCKSMFLDENGKITNVAFLASFDLDWIKVKSQMCRIYQSSEIIGFLMKGSFLW